MIVGCMGHWYICFACPGAVSRPATGDQGHGTKELAPAPAKALSSATKKIGPGPARRLSFGAADGSPGGGSDEEEFFEMGLGPADGDLLEERQAGILLSNVVDDSVKPVAPVDSADALVDVPGQDPELHFRVRLPFAIPRRRSPRESP